MISFSIPWYDSHGNMVSTIARSGSGFAVGDVRTYDVWGGGDGGGLGTDHGEGAGVYYEKRATWMYDLTQALIDSWDGIKDFWEEHFIPKLPTRPEDWLIVL